MSEPQVVLIESLSNQAFIFSSNRLREIIGASELIHSIGAAHVPGVALARDPASEGGPLEDSLLDPEHNPPLSAGGNCEIIVAASGKTLLLTRDAGVARRIIRDVTSAMLVDAPGLGVMGAFVPADLTNAATLQASIARVHRRVERLRASRPPIRVDLLRLPFAADCRSTGDAAAGFDPKDPVQKNLGPDDAMPLYSESILAKRRAAPGGIARLVEIFGEGTLDLDMARDVGGPSETDDGEGETWTAIIHADGNGLGQVFLDFAPCAAAAEAQTRNTALQSPQSLPAEIYVDWLRRFSIALDRCTRLATKEAVEAVWPEGNAGLRPIVLAGDDLTVQCDGARAVAFTLSFMEAFERTTRADEVVSRVLASREGDRFVPACVTLAAGIAIVKAHHPLHRAYELAEALTNSAKRIKSLVPGGSAFDLHVSYDGGSDLDLARERLRRTRGDGDSDLLHGGPYQLEWTRSASGRRLFTAGDLVAAVRALSGGKAAARSAAPGLPRGQQHALRSAVLQGRDAAAAALARIRHRYDGVGETGTPALDALAPEGALFASLGETGQDAGCLLLDALAIVDTGADTFLAREAVPQTEGAA